MRYREHFFSEGQEKNPPSKAKKLVAIAGIFFGIFSALQDALYAKVSVEELSPGKELTLAYQKSEKEPMEFLRVVTFGFSGLASYSSKKPLESALMESVRRTNVHIPGTNETIGDEKKFQTFLEENVEALKKDEKWLTVTNKSKWSLRDIISIAIKIIEKNFYYDTRLRQDKRLSNEIDEKPIDQLIPGGGVCRHASVIFTAVVNGLIDISGKEAMRKNTYIDEIASFSDDHAWNVIYHLTEYPERGMYLPAQLLGKKRVLEMAFIDVTKVNENVKQFGERASEINFNNALRPDHASVEEGFKAHFLPALTFSEQRDVLKALFEFQERGVPNIAILRTIISSYKKDIVSIVSRTDTSQTDNLRREYEEFQKKAERILDEYLKSILKQTGEERVRNMALVKDGYIVLDAIESAKLAWRNLFDAIDVNTFFFLKFKTGEEYAEFLASQGNIDEAVRMYDELYTLYQSASKNKNEMYEIEVNFFAEKVKVQPFVDEKKFQEYLSRKKEQWQKNKK